MGARYIGRVGLPFLLDIAAVGDSDTFSPTHGELRTTVLAANRMQTVWPRVPDTAGSTIAPEPTRITVADAVNAAPPTPVPVAVTHIAVGDHPVAVVIGGNYAYVANLSDNSVSVIDTRTDLVVTTIAEVARPYAMTASPDGKRVYVSDSTGGSSNVATITVIDTSTNTVAGTIDVPVQHNYGSDLVVSPDGLHLYVRPESACTMSVVDLDPENTTTHHKVISTANIGQVGRCGDMSITPDGSRIYLAPNYASAVYVIDTDTTAITDAVVEFNEQSEGFAQRVAISPNGTHAYVLVKHVTENGLAHGCVAVIDIDPSSGATYNTTVAMISGCQFECECSRPWKDFALSPDGGRLYVTMSDGMSVSVIDTDTCTVRGTFVTTESTGRYADDFWGELPRPVAVAPNGTVYVAEIDGTLHAVTVSHRGVARD